MNIVNRKNDRARKVVDLVKTVTCLLIISNTVIGK